MTYKICVVCGKEFGIKKPCEAKRPSRMCCSPSCASTRKNKERYAGIGMWKICKGCTKRFFAKYARERNRKTFCTDVCGTVWRNKNVSPTPETRKKMSEIATKLFKGIKRQRAAVRKSAAGISGDKHW